MELPIILQVSREVGLAGGSECVAFELHSAWSAAGVKAALVTGNVTEQVATEEAIPTAPWFRNCGKSSRLRHLGALFAVPYFTLAATFRIASRRDPKIVLSHGDCLVGDVCVVHAVNRACLAEKRRMGYYSWLLNPLNVWIELRDRWMFGGERYRRLVAVSERVRSELKRYYRVRDERIITIPNGISLSRFNPGNVSSRNEVRRRFGLNETVPLILFVGSRFRIKGLKFAIQALAEMKTEAVLLIVGDDSSRPYKRLAERLGVSDRVVFIGARKDLSEVYPAADAFLLPSLYETFALVCLEAMASGLPVVAAPVGGIEDYLKDGQNGFHIHYDPMEIAGTLDRLLTDSELQERIRANGLATAQSYAWESIAHRYLQLFQELVAEHSHVNGTPKNA